MMAGRLSNPEVRPPDANEPLLPSFFHPFMHSQAHSHKKGKHSERGSSSIRTSSSSTGSARPTRPPSPLAQTEAPEEPLESGFKPPAAHSSLSAEFKPSAHDVREPGETPTDMSSLVFAFGPQDSFFFSYGQDMTW